MYEIYFGGEDKSLKIGNCSLFTSSDKHEEIVFRLLCIRKGITIGDIKINDIVG